MPSFTYLDMGRPRLIALIGVFLIAALAGLRECGARRSAERVFAEWMSRNCAVKEGGTLEAELLRYASRLEPRLEEAFLQGPPAAARAEGLRVAQRERNEVLAAIDAGKTHGLSAEAISRLRAESRERVTDRVLDDYVEGYRSAALAGLGVIGAGRAREFLEGIRRDSKHRDYWDAAGLSLQRPAPRRP